MPQGSPATTFTVPLIDISAYTASSTPRAREVVARGIDRACREVGFIQITGHGIDPRVIDGLASVIDAFFALDLDTKSAYRKPPEVNRGYSPPASESLSLSLGIESATRMNDFFEAFNVGAGQAHYPHAPQLPQPDYAKNLWPDLDGFRVEVEAYFDEAARVARTMTRIFADALGLAPDFFEQFTDHSLDVLRMNNYALSPGTDVRPDGDLTGMGEHTDYGIVTVLWADRVAGLQVLDGDGIWHHVSPDEGALLINLGDLTARWTNDRWLSTLHRVKPPLVDGSIHRRRSAAFFHDGNVDAVISTLATCVDASHPDLYTPITVGEHVPRHRPSSCRSRPIWRATRSDTPGQHPAASVAGRRRVLALNAGFHGYEVRSTGRSGLRPSGSSRRRDRSVSSRPARVRRDARRLEGTSARSRADHPDDRRPLPRAAPLPGVRRHVPVNVAARRP